MGETISTQVLIIGGGPGGYVAAIRAAQLGLRVTVVEQQYYGGTCLNVGCIPSKALLEDSKRFSELAHLKERGIEIEGARLDWEAMKKRKSQVVDQLVKGVRHLLSGNEVAMLDGKAAFIDEHTVEVTGADGVVRVEAEHIIIATGSVPIEIPPIKVDHQRVWDSTSALSAPEVPRVLGVIGGGYIGMELASVFSRLGAEVHVIEMLPSILPGIDAELAKEAARVFKKQKLQLHTAMQLRRTEPLDAGLILHIAGADDQEEAIEVSHALVAVGRRPYSAGLKLEAAGLGTDQRGFIPVDVQLRTAQPHIYAIGDVIGGMMLAHKASFEGECVAELIAGHQPELDRPIPAVVFTSPQIATVGLTEEQAAEAGHEVKVGRFAFRASGYAKALAELDGFAKWVADAKTDQLLGCNIIGPHAGELIHEATLALMVGARATAVQNTIHAHPTLSEVMHEAALGLDGRAIHALN